MRSVSHHGLFRQQYMNPTELEADNRHEPVSLDLAKQDVG